MKLHVCVLSAINATGEIVQTGWLIRPPLKKNVLFQVQFADGGLLRHETDDDIPCRRLHPLEPLGIRHPER